MTEANASVSGEKKQLKTGGYTAQEKRFISQHAGTKTAAEIAALLERSEKGVENYIRDELTLGDRTKYAEKMKILDELHISDIWLDAEQIYSPDELRQFESVWIQIIHQFNNDLEYTEKLQVRDLCRTEIMMSRNLIEQRLFITQLEELTKQKQELQQELVADPLGNPGLDSQLIAMEGLINNFKTSSANRESQYIKLHEQKQKIYDKINANRTDRIKHVNAGKASLLGLLRMMDQPEFREKEGRELELMKLATKKEVDRLSEYHEYQDGTLDRPFFFPEFVTDEDG
jgi:hypothetical protein